MRKNFLILSVAAACVAGSCSILHACDLSQNVYVESNLPAAGSDSIYAFSRGSDCSLKPIPDPPFLTGGAGVQRT